MVELYYDLVSCGKMLRWCEATSAQPARRESEGKWRDAAGVKREPTP